MIGDEASKLGRNCEDDDGLEEHGKDMVSGSSLGRPSGGQPGIATQSDGEGDSASITKATTRHFDDASDGWMGKT